MDFKYKYPGCVENAFWECTCREISRFCKLHFDDHQQIVKCFYKPIDIPNDATIVKKMSNALYILDSESMH